MLLRIENLSKKFGKIYALNNISMDIEEGEIHGLVGENGAGKSTLIKMLTGVYSIEEGDIIWNSHNTKIESPHHSQTLGINVIHQDRHLIPSFSGVENIFLGIEYEKKMKYIIDYKKMRTRVKEVIAELGIDVPLDIHASKLTPPQATLIEIVRAMMTQCKLLILDEPTASLTDKETEILFRLIKKLKKAGTSILYVTHRMDEIFELTDRVTVFRNGEKIDTVMTNQTNKDGLVTLMSGDFVSFKKNQNTNFGEEVIVVNGIKSNDGKVISGDFSVKKGEILGIFGLGGSGRTELLESIYGSRKAEGSIMLNGKEYKKRSPRLSLMNGVVLISEDRRGKALITSLTVKENTVLATLDKYAAFGFLSKKKELLDTNSMIKKLSIKTYGANQRISELSGGNQQKVVFAKALLSKPKVILCDEPTQAVDIKTRNEIHRLLKNMADEGTAVVFVSSDLKEVLDIADNVLVMANGSTREKLNNKSLSAEAVLASCYNY